MLPSSHPLLGAAAGLSLIASAQAAATTDYIWPNPKIDALESLLFEHSGYQAVSPASFVVPCGRVPFGTGRSGPAEWVRTAYHDMATADVEAGTGGIDASIGFEVNRGENLGKGFNETLENLAGYMSARTSMADLIAMGAMFAVAGCSNAKVVLPYRGGRIDATGPGPIGVPKPEEDLDTHLSSFKRQGFNQDEMIGLVACGHTLGGIHGVDFPEIVDVVNDPATDDNTQMFDTTIQGSNAFDNTVATQFVNNVTQNPLAFGHNVTTRSDARIFNADGGELIRKMAGSNDFFLQTCNTLLERMINTVPKEVTLTEPIDMIPVKPSRLFATINANGTMTATGHIRLIDPPDPKSVSRAVKVHFRPRSCEDCTKTNTCIVDDVPIDPPFWTIVMYGNYPILRKYGFHTEIPISHGISGFDVEVIDTTVNGMSTSTMYTNGGNGFPFDDTILTQPFVSCGEQTQHGLLNLTVAIRDDAKLTSLKGHVQVPTPLDSLVPAIKSTDMEFTRIEGIPGTGYTFYTGVHNSTVGTYIRTYDLIASNETHTVERQYNEMPGIPKCPFVNP